MKTIEISTAPKSLADYTNDIGNEFIVLTSNNKPVAALVSLKNVDPESLALSTNREFMELIENARKEVVSGQTLSLDDMKEEFDL